MFNEAYIRKLNLEKSFVLLMNYLKNRLEDMLYIRVGQKTAIS